MPDGARVLVGVAAIAAAYLLTGMGLRLLGGPLWLWVAAFIPCAMWTIYRLFRPHERRRERRAKGQYAAGGYDPRGNASGVCPECGASAPDRGLAGGLARRSNSHEFE